MLLLILALHLHKVQVMKHLISTASSSNSAHVTVYVRYFNLECFLVSCRGCGIGEDIALLTLFSSFSDVFSHGKYCGGCSQLHHGQKLLCRNTADAWLNGNLNTDDSSKPSLL